MKMLRYRKTIVIAVLLLAAAGGFYVWRASSNSVPAYHEATVQRGDIEINVLATGVVQPRNRLEIKPPIAGRVEDVLVSEGQSVARGQALAWISSTERAALMDAARAKGADEVRRWEELYRPTPILAPLAGSVISRQAEPGQTVTAQDAIFVMSDRLIVRASVDETDIARVRLRQPAQITLDAYPDHTFAGVVEQIAFDAKTVNNVTTYEVDVLSAKPPPFMRSGMTVNVSFLVQARHGVLHVPAEAVATRGNASYVLVPPAARGAAPVEKTIQVGLSDGKRTEVVSGLSEGEKIAVPGAAWLDTSGGGRTSPLSPFRRR